MMLALLFVSVVDLNAATSDQLQALPGIGKKKAEAILDFRTKRPFRRSTELMRIRGIGPKLYTRLKDEVCAGSACPNSSQESAQTAPR